jgi:hypothetical protein
MLGWHAKCGNCRQDYDPAYPSCPECGSVARSHEPGATVPPPPSASSTHEAGAPAETPPADGAPPEDGPPAGGPRARRRRGAGRGPRGER